MDVCNVLVCQIEVAFYHVHRRVSEDNLQAIGVTTVLEIVESKRVPVFVWMGVVDSGAIANAQQEGSKGMAAESVSLLSDEEGVAAGRCLAQFEIGKNSVEGVV